MTSYIRASMISLVALCLSGCGLSPIGKTTLMDEIMDSWVGAPAIDIIVAWGKPSYDKTISGQRLMMWETKSRYRVGEIDDPITRELLDLREIKPVKSSEKLVCRRIVRLDEDEVITKAQWSGDNCPSFEGKLAKSWRRQE